MQTLVTFSVAAAALVTAAQAAAVMRIAAETRRLLETVAVRERRQIASQFESTKRYIHSRLGMLHGDR